MTAHGGVLYYEGTDAYHGRELRKLVPDLTAPVVQNMWFDPDGNQVVVRFSENVFPSLGPGDLRVEDSSGAPVLFTGLIHYDVASNTASFPLGGLHADGNYRAKIEAGSVADSWTNSLMPGEPINFHILAADANRDRKVDIKDLVILAKNWQGTGKTFSQGDFNYDGVVNAVDLGILGMRWQVRLDAPLPPAPAVPTTAQPAARTAVRTPTRVMQLISEPSAEIVR